MVTLHATGGNGMASAGDVLRAGIGLTGLTREDVEKIFEELKKRGEAEENRREEFVRKIGRKLARKGRNTVKKAKRVARKILKTAHDKIESVNTHIEDVVKELQESKQSGKIS
jgi:polyhydroxyalkanoate synthesis regulator phasin